jgi:hypothetical protein
MDTAVVIPALDAPSADPRALIKQLGENAPQGPGAVRHREATPLPRAATGSEDRGLAMAAQWALEQLR